MSESVLKAGKESIHPRPVGCRFKRKPSGRTGFRHPPFFFLASSVLGLLQSLFPLTQRRKWYGCIKQTASSISFSDSFCAGTRPFTDLSLQGALEIDQCLCLWSFPDGLHQLHSKNYYPHFHQNPSCISWRTLCYLMISGTWWDTISPWEFLRDLSLQGRNSTVFVNSQDYNVTQHLGTQVFYSYFPFTPGTLFHSVLRLGGSFFLPFIKFWTWF